MKCYVIVGLGGDVGLDFVSIGVSVLVDYFVELLIDLNVKIKENFYLKMVLIFGGKIYMGILIL